LKYIVRIGTRRTKLPGFQQSHRIILESIFRAEELLRLIEACKKKVIVVFLGVKTL
jgi:hypothetical protein